MAALHIFTSKSVFSLERTARLHRQLVCRKYHQQYESNITTTIIIISSSPLWSWSWPSSSWSWSSHRSSSIPSPASRPKHSQNRLCGTCWSFSNTKVLFNHYPLLTTILPLASWFEPTHLNMLRMPGKLSGFLEISVITIVVGTKARRKQKELHPPHSMISAKHFQKDNYGTNPWFSWFFTSQASHVHPRKSF